MAGRGGARQGKAGKARHGRAGRGKAWQARRGTAGPGLAWRGKAWQNILSSCPAWRA